MARTTDPVFNTLRTSDHFVVGTTPYYVARDPDRASVVEAWGNAGSGAGEMAMLTLADIPTSDADAKEVEALAQLAIDVVMEAYDHPQRAVFFSADPAAITAT